VSQNSSFFAQLPDDNSFWDVKIVEKSKNFLLTGDVSGIVKVYDLNRSMAKIAHLNVKGSISCIAISPNQKYFAVGMSIGVIRI